MVDIPGPKIRAGSFGTTPVELHVGDEIELVEAYDEASSASASPSSAWAYCPC